MLLIPNTLILTDLSNSRHYLDTLHLTSSNLKRHPKIYPISMPNEEKTCKKVRENKNYTSTSEEKVRI